MSCGSPAEPCTRGSVGGSAVYVTCEPAGVARQCAAHFTNRWDLYRCSEVDDLVTANMAWTVSDPSVGTFEPTRVPTPCLGSGRPFLLALHLDEHVIRSGVVPRKRLLQVLSGLRVGLAWQLHPQAVINVGRDRRTRCIGLMTPPCGMDNHARRPRPGDRVDRGAGRLGERHLDGRGRHGVPRGSGHPVPAALGVPKRSQVNHGHRAAEAQTIAPKALDHVVLDVSERRRSGRPWTTMFLTCLDDDALAAPGPRGS